MAIVQNPIIGRTKQSAGGMTFTTNLRRNVIRAKAFAVANPNTEKQQHQRAILSGAAKCSASVTDVLKKYGISAEASKRKMYPSNLITQAMAKSRYYDIVGAAFGEASLAFGSNHETGVFPVSIKKTAGGLLRVSWDNSARTQQGLPSVNVAILLRKGDQDEGEAIEPVEMTEDEYYESLEAQPQFAIGDKVHVWIATLNNGTKKASRFNDGGFATLTVSAV